MNELELEELESQLYSQIYHETHEENQENSTIPTSNLINSSAGMKNPNRYFGPWSPHQKFQRGSPRKKNSNLSPTPNAKRIGDVYPKDSGKPYQPDNISINQVVVVSPKRPIVCLSGKEIRSEYWREKSRLKRKRQKERRRLAAQRNEQEFQEYNESIVLVQENTAVQENNKNDTVITLTDSEDDSCVLLENEWPVLSVVDSDDEKDVKSEEKESEVGIKTKEEKKSEPSSSDDVIFIEPLNSTLEVIDIDEESECSPQEAHSSSSTNNSKQLTTEQQLHQERKELLNTPDSASNDFMSNSGVELKQRNFNFSLHGADFNGGSFTKPANPGTEHCETESSSSTTDVNCANLMKTVVFNEVEFPKDDIFAEGNLERFESLITPSRSCANNTVAQSTPIKTSEVHNQNVYSSESSESDFEMDKSKSKTLPELSHFHKSPEKQKGEQKDEKQKTKSKKKKKNGPKESEKNDEKLNEEDVKQKKRKSSGLEDDGVIETPPRKKNKKKKKIEAAEAVDKEIVEDGNLDNESFVGVTNEENLTPQNRVSKSDNKVDDVKINKITKNNNKQCSPLEGFIVIDEVNETKSRVISSDCESVLSALNDDIQIQINTETENKKNENVLLSSETERNGDNFSVRELQQKMSNDPKLWDILDSDRMPPGRSRGRRCNKCRQYGHGPLRCPNKTYPKCQLCGEPGHYEPRCPNKLCTQCGQKSNYLTNYCSSCFKFRNYRCRLCSLQGHVAEKCPDLWRRYHLTLSEGPLKSYDGPVLKRKEELWCSGCACNGHLEHDCTFFQSLYPPSDPNIKSYEDVYEKRNDRRSYEGPSNENQPNLRPNPFNTTTQMNYSVQNPPNINPNLILGPNYQRHQNTFSNNYYNPTNFGLINNQLQGLMFLANQQNFLNARQNVYSIPQNNMTQQVSNFQQAQYNTNRQMSQNPQQTFEKPLPSFISLDTNTSEVTNYKEVPRMEIKGSRYFKRVTRTSKRFNMIFCSSSSEGLQQFITEELQTLSKLTLVATKVAKELRKRQVPTRSQDREEYYRTLNMILFGVFNFLEGKMHVERLKQFKLERYKGKVNNPMRLQLLKSFMYIFGQYPHEGVDYTNLLRQF